MKVIKSDIEVFFLDNDKKIPDKYLIRNFKKVCDVFNIRKQHWFFIQCLYESGWFKNRMENLNYTSLKRLRRVFGDRIPKDDSKASELLLNPTGLADVVYKHLLTGEAKTAWTLTGWDMIGEDWIQITGEKNKQHFMDETEINCWEEPKWFSQPENSWIASGFYWYIHDIDFCVDFKEATKKITGPSLIGYKNRLELLKKFYKIIKENYQSYESISPTNELPKKFKHLSK